MVSMVGTQDRTFDAFHRNAGIRLAADGSVVHADDIGRRTRVAVKNVHMGSGSCTARHRSEHALGDNEALRHSLHRLEQQRATLRRKGKVQVRPQLIQDVTRRKKEARRKKKMLLLQYPTAKT